MKIITNNINLYRNQQGKRRPEASIKTTPHILDRQIDSDENKNTIRCRNAKLYCVCIDNEIVSNVNTRKIVFVYSIDIEQF